MHLISFKRYGNIFFFKLIKDNNKKFHVYNIELHCSYEQIWSTKLFFSFFFSLVPFSPHYWPLAEYRTAIQPSEHARLDQINALAL